MNVASGYRDAGASEMTDYEPVHVRRQRSMKFSLYPAARPRTASKSSAVSGSTSPSFAPSQHSPRLPREDSLPGHHQQQRPYTSHHTQGHGNEGRSFTPPSAMHQQQQQHYHQTQNHNQNQSPHFHKKPAEISRLRALNNGYRSHSSEGRSTPDRSAQDYIPDNFSRPRQPSIKRRQESPQPVLHNASTFPLPSSHDEQSSNNVPSSRDRGMSTSSSRSATYQPTYTLRPSASIPDYQSPESIYSRQRNLNNPNYRAARGPIPLDNSYANHKREPVQRPPGFEGEEVRASFRSALTTNSSFLGTSGTERSSVVTKSSSRTSIFGRDEGMSVDDAIGMYEGGFTDSDVATNYGTRPPTASSEQQRISGLEDAMGHSLGVPSNIITRDSTQIFKAGLDAPPAVPQDDGHHESLDLQEAYFDEKPAPAKPVTRIATEPFDETRDQYGFRKKTQHVPLDKYEAWAGPYAEHVARRRKKWVALMKDNGLSSNHPDHFPPRSDKVKRFIRKGIPPDWRGAAWFWYAGGPTLLEKHPGVYADLVRRAAAGQVSETDDEIIERDLNRTFPDNIKFKPDPVPVAPGEARNSQRTIAEPETPILQSLRRVLQAFSIYNPKIGYCQSLNFLAGLLLLFMDEEKSFWMLNTITRVYLPGTHELNLEGANVDLGVLMTSIKDMMPSIWAKIGGELDGSSLPPSTLRLPPITLCTTAWFMSCFIGTLPIETTLRVWDAFFYEGSKTLFRIALTVFKVGEQEIKAVNDPMEIFQVVQTIPRRLIDCNHLMDMCYKRRNGFGHLSQDTIEKGRAERRKGYAEERERTARGEAGTTNAPGLTRSSTKKAGALFRRGKKGEV